MDLLSSLVGAAAHVAGAALAAAGVAAPALAAAAPDAAGAAALAAAGAGDAAAPRRPTAIEVAEAGGPDPLRLTFEEHFTLRAGALGDGSFGEVFAADPTQKGEEFLRRRLRELGRASDGGLPQLIVKAPKVRDLTHYSASERAHLEKDARLEKTAMRAWHHPGIVTFFGDFASSQDARGRLVLEACYGAAPSRDHVAGVGATCDGPVTFIDEYGHDLRRKALKGASNGDFWRYVQTRLQPSDTVFRFIAWQLLTPVAYLHLPKNSVAHRDLKNENFLVSGEIITEANEAVPVVKVCLRAVCAFTRPHRHLDPLSLLSRPPSSRTSARREC